jgi:hypothetical protein
MPSHSAPQFSGRNAKNIVVLQMISKAPIAPAMKRAIAGISPLGFCLTFGILRGSISPNNYSTNRFVVRRLLFQGSSFSWEVNVHESLLLRNACWSTLKKAGLSGKGVGCKIWELGV